MTKIIPKLDKLARFQTYMRRHYHLFDNYILKHFNPNIQDWIRLMANVFLVTVIYFIVYQTLYRGCTLPFKSYYNTFIYYEFLKLIVSLPLVLILILFFIGYFNKKLFIEWKEFKGHRPIRFFLVVVAFTLTWYFSTYSTNFYFNQFHLPDRILLVLFCIGVYWKPIFITLYLPLLLCIIGQFESVPFFSFASPPFLLIKLLILFVVFFLLKLTTNSFNPLLFIFMVGCIIATHYVTPGLRKFNIYWAFKNQMHFLIPSAYANGWLSFFSVKTIEKLTDLSSWFNIPLRLFAILVECGMILFFSHLKWARFLIIAAIIMHFGIFGYTGIFFWMWIIVLFASLYIFNTKTYRVQKIFTRKHAVISVFLITSGQYWCGAKSLTWLDAPLSYTYKIYGETTDGRRYQMGPKFFSLYDFQMTSGMFKFWQNQPRLPIIWGATDLKTSAYFSKERTQNEVLEYERKEGKLHVNEQYKKKYEDFLVQFVSHWNDRKHDQTLTYYFKAPPFYWTTPPSSICLVEQDIEKIIIVESTTFYSKKEGFKEIRKQELKELNVLKNTTKH